MAFTQFIDMYVKHNPWKFHRNPTSSKGPCFWEKGEMCFAYIDLFLCLFDYLLINSDKKIIVAVWVWRDQRYRFQPAAEPRLSNDRGSLMWISGSLCDDDDSQDGQEVDSKLIHWILQQKGMETSPLMAISIFLALLYYVSNVFFHTYPHSWFARFCTGARNRSLIYWVEIC